MSASHLRIKIGQSFAVYSIFSAHATTLVFQKYFTWVWETIYSTAQHVSKGHIATKIAGIHSQTFFELPKAY